MSRYEEALYEAANYACELAYVGASRQLQTLKGGRTCFFPKVNEEEGIFSVGLNTEYHYLIYQENGFESFPMSWAIGRVVPMLINGRIVYRKCRGVGYEQPWLTPNQKNYWQRGDDGNLMPVYGPKVAWTHPGLPPKNFIKDAIESAEEEYENEINAAIFLDKLSKMKSNVVGKAMTIFDKLRSWF